METARGRWFLAEVRRPQPHRRHAGAARRDRAARAGGRRRAQRPALDRLRFDLMEMAEGDRHGRRRRSPRSVRTTTRIATSWWPPRPLTRSAAPPSARRRTSSARAEHIQEAAWTLREDGANAALCDELDRRATEIYTACSFQDLTAQRIAKIVQTLRYLEGRINAMIDIWGSAGMPEGATRRPPPDLQGAGEHPADLSQNDVDIVIVNDGFASGPGLPDERRFALSRAPLDASPAAARSSLSSRRARSLRRLTPPFRTSGRRCGSTPSPRSTRSIHARS